MRPLFGIYSKVFISNVFKKLTEYEPPDGDDFFRTVSIGLEFASSHIRKWSLSRTLSQGITFASNAIGYKFIVQFYHRFVSLSMSLTSNASAYQFISQLFTIIVSMSNLENH